MTRFEVSPLKAEVEVARVCVAPVCSCPAGPREVIAVVRAELVIVGETEPTTVKEEHDTLPEHVAEEVAVPYTPAPPFEVSSWLEEGWVVVERPVKSKTPVIEL